MSEQDVRADVDLENVWPFDATSPLPGTDPLPQTSGDPAERYRFSHSLAGVRIAAAIFLRVSGSRSRL